MTPTSSLTGDSIVIVAADGSSRRTLVEANVGIFSPTMSPDGTRLAYEDSGAIHVVDVATGETTEVASEGAGPSGSTTTRSSCSAVTCTGAGSRPRGSERTPSCT